MVGDMNNRWSSIWYLTGRKALSRSRHGWWSGVTEATIASLLVLGGVVLMVVFLTINFMSETPTDLYSWILDYFIKPVFSLAMVGIGGYMMLNAIWKVGASAERRGAIRANQRELLNEIGRGHGDLPTVPSRSNSPQKGQRLPFRIMASREGIWGLITAGVLCLVFVATVVVLIVTAYAKLKMGRTDWVAGGVAIPTMFAATWSFYRFLRQLLKTISIGPTVVEVERYPIVPGELNRVFLSQFGRLRLKLIDVHLVCVEEATFNQGTNTLTEKKRVFSRRLFRKRGIKLSSREPFQTEFEFSLPLGAMHSFQSSSNRVAWQIEVHGQTKGFPRVLRNFEVIVTPRVVASVSRTAQQSV